MNEIIFPRFAQNGAYPFQTEWGTWTQRFASVDRCLKFVFQKYYKGQFKTAEIGDKKVLVSLKEEALIAKETGLSLIEAYRIHSYVKENLSLWQSWGKFGTLRRSKESTFLPRTIHLVCEDDGRLYVMVLCKKKNIDGVGWGCFKKATRAIDWNSGSIFVFSNHFYNSRSPKDSQDFQNKELAVEKLVNEPHPLPRHVKPSSFGALCYRHALTVEHEGYFNMKVGYFNPMFEGTLLKAVNNRIFSFSQKAMIIGQLIDNLVYLEAMGICHFDFTLDNIFYSLSDRPRIYLADWGSAVKVDEADNKDLLVPFKENYRPPESALFCESLDKEAHERNWLQTYHKFDIWTAGLCILSLFSGRERRVNNAKELAESFKAGEPSFMKYRPQEDSLLMIPYKMLQLDYRHRPTARGLKKMYDKWSNK